MWVYLAVIIVAAIILYVIYVFNRLITLRARVNNAWAQIDTQLRRRYDLIPNLVEAVKGYMGYERKVLNEVTKARAAMAGATSPGEKSRANDMLTGALKSLFAVSERYPDLKASKNFMMLQEELAGTENKIAYSRQFYNDSVLGYNAYTQSFPARIFASPFRFEMSRDFFKTVGEAREPVKVKF